MRNGNVGLGKYIYTEWLFPIFDYYSVIKKNEAIFEIVVPLLVSSVCTYLYYTFGDVNRALSALSEILPTAISILIGFTFMMITLLLTATGETIEKLKKYNTEKTLHKKKMNLYQGLHIQFSHSLFSEIFLLLIIFFYLFLNGLGWIGKWNIIFMLVEVYLTLNILLSVLRGIANLYFSFYNNGNN